MKNIIKQISIIVAVLAVFFLGGFMAGRMRPTPSTVETRTDTVIVRDTIREEVPVVKYSLTTRVDTVFVKVAGDTVLVAAEIPIERKTYQTEDYKAVIEGFRPSLVSMEIYRQTRFIDRVQTVKVPDTQRWGIGLQVGYGLSAQQGAIRAYPYIGVGLTYDIMRW